MNTRSIPMAILFGLLGGSAVMAVDVQKSSIYDEWRKSPSPTANDHISRNPPPLLWPSVQHWEGRTVRYNVRLSDTPTLSSGESYQADGLRSCFYNPPKKLHSGTWYWHYHVNDGVQQTIHGPYQFEVRGNEAEFSYPTAKDFADHVAISRPRLSYTGLSMEEAQDKVAHTELGQRTIAHARKELNESLYDGPVSSTNPAEDRRLIGLGSREVARCRTLLWAYFMTGDQAFRDALIKRLAILVTWPTDDLLGSQVLLTLALCHDAVGALIPEDLHKQMLAVIRKRLAIGLQRWPGVIEGRQVENHFWQMELPGNFLTAVATLGDIPEASDMLEYTYGIYLARFPNLATEDGGWAEGFGYLMVNQMTMIDMSLILKRYGVYGAFDRNWYKTIPEYLLYFAPNGGPADGFGDGHERTGTNGIGHALNALIDRETDNPFARLRAVSGMQSGRPAFGEDWNPITNHGTITRVPLEPAKHLPQSRLFRDVGLAAMHTNVSSPNQDLAVYFRSSPFGAKGHMHANQNAFNISFNAERMFYSSGFYTSFADPHSLSSYRHTRAHNTILVNGCGQAFGHEGYGRIVGYLDTQSCTYVCGDASMAYRKTTDKQFIDLMKENGIANDEANGFADSRLKRFYRHVALLPPNMVVVFDDLESEAESEWSLLLHSPFPSEITSSGTLAVKSSASVVDGIVMSSDGIKGVMTDQYFTKPVDIKKKYGDMPNAYHMTFTNGRRSKAARFLTILVFTTKDQGKPSIINESGRQIIGDFSILSDLDVNKPARVLITRMSTGASLTINSGSTSDAIGALYRTQGQVDQASISIGR